MTEKLLELLFCTVMIFLFSLNFNSKWTNRNYEKLKSNNLSWYWFRVFKIAETKENFIKFRKGLSVFVIMIMVITIIVTLLT
jgi:hypothetical protein